MDCLFTINRDELQQLILDYISTDKLYEALENQIDGNNPMFKNGFIFGLSWAALLTTQCKEYLVVENKEGE